MHSNQKMCSFRIWFVILEILIAHIDRQIVAIVFSIVHFPFSFILTSKFLSIILYVINIFMNVCRMH